MPTRPSCSTQHEHDTRYDALGDVGHPRPTKWGGNTKYQYDNLGRKTEEIDPRPEHRSTARLTRVSATTYYNYDANGNLLSTTDPDVHTTWTDYDALNRAVKTVSADGSGPNDTHYATTTTYDAAGNVLERDRPRRQHDELRLRQAQRQIETIDPLHNASYDVYDLDGNVIQTTDADGRVTQYVYTPLTDRSKRTGCLLSRGPGRRRVPLPPGEGQGEGLVTGATISHTITTSCNADGETVGVVKADAGRPHERHELRVRLRRRRPAKQQPHGPRRNHAISHDGPPLRLHSALTELDYQYLPNGEVYTVGRRIRCSHLVGQGGWTAYGYNALSAVVNIWQGGPSTTTSRKLRL